ncbi:MAG: hypothetical protein KatS3mg092_0636 [Patescibacteria group bacterium]|nr:MAG: hypothetical protein KatS3mg092_0636 [Patescibacteria group bacterium]
MKKIFYEITIIFFFLFFLPFLREGIVFAAIINFDKTNISVNNNEIFSLQVNIDVGNDEVRSTDIYLNYDANYLQVESVSNGGFFPTVIKETSTDNQIYIAGMVDDPGVTKTGSGTIATINFKTKNSGSTTISLNCSSSKIVKADIDTTNILDCGQNPSISISVKEDNTNNTNNTNNTSNNNAESSNLIYPTPTNSTLPKTGIFENVVKFSIPGVILLLIGGLLRLVV